MDVKPLGFTLLEAIIATAIGSVSIGIAVPAISKTVNATRHVAARTTLIETLMTASTHAISTNTDVVLCPSNDGASCAKGQTKWNGGWIAYADLDGNRQRNGFETLLRQHTAIDSVGITSSQGRTRVVFQPRGDVAGSNLTFTLCDKRGPEAATTIVMGNSGRWRVGKAAIAAAEQCIAQGWRR